MAALSLRLLGPPEIQSGAGAIRLPSHKALALLVYLAAQPGRAVSRSRLAGLLWEDKSETEGRNSLSTALTRLRQALPLFPISADGDNLVWRPGPDVWVDLDGLTAPGASLADLQAAADLWRGPFLDGFEVRDSAGYDEWLSQTRAYVERVYCDLLGRLTDAAQAQGDWARARSAAQRGLAVDPLQERFHRALMLALAQAGDRAAALAQYRACVETLRDQLGTAPDPETARLFEQIRDGRLARSAPQPARWTIVPRPTRAPALPLIERQRELGALLEHLSRTEGRQLAAGRRQKAEGSGEQAAGSGEQAISNLQSPISSLQSPVPTQLILVQGEAGIGKSRLLAELVWRLSQGQPGGWTVLEGHCYEAERSLPYHPFVDALAPLAAALDPADLGLADVWLAELARLLPDLAGALPAGQAQHDQRRLFEAVARFLTALPAPLLLILDDLHWADAGTLQLLAYLVRHLADAPILFVAAARSEDIEPDLANTLWRLEREGRLVTLRLPRLSPQATTRLVREMGHVDSESLGARLYSETEGNPLFTVEIVRSLQESGALQAGAGRRAALALPASVVAVIQTRLARLAPATREFLAACSVFRRDFTFDAARQVSGQGENAALDALDELLHTGLLNEISAPGEEPRYTFSHDKVRQVVYTGLSAARCMTLHRRAVTALGAPADARDAERVAYHAYQGQLWEEGLTWSLAAAEGARAVYAFATAALLYQQALDCLGRLPTTDDRRRLGIEVRLSLSRVGFYIQPGRLMVWLAQAEEDALALGDSTLLALVWLAQSGSLYIRGRFREAQPRLERLLPLVERLGEPLQVARTLNILGRLLTMAGDAGRGFPLLAQAIAGLEAAGAHNDALISRGMLGAERGYQGQFEAGLAEVQAVYAASLDQPDPAVHAAATCFLQALYHTWGRWAEAETWGRRAARLTQDALNLVYERNVYIYLGLPLAYQGDLDGARAALERSIALGGECQSTVFMGRAHAWLAETLLLAGESAQAQAQAEQGRDLAEADGARLDLALARRALGQALAGQGRLAEAQAELTEAQALLRALGAEPEAARALAALARVALAAGQLDQARVWRDEAAQTFRRLGMTWDLGQLEPLASSP